MKIVIVTDAWFPQISGVVTTYQQTVRCLTQLGHQVSTINPLQFPTVPCPTYPEISLSLLRPGKIEKALEKIGPDAVHIATEGPLGWSARSVCLQRRFPFSSAYHTRFPEYLRLRFPVPLRLSYCLMRKFHNASNRILVASESLKCELEQKGFTNLNIWSRGVDIDLFRPQSNNAKSDNPIFTYVGRIAPEKNLEAFLELALPGEKWVIGDGPQLMALKSRYPSVRFFGFLHGKGLATRLAASSVFVFPSRTDTFGIVQLEAMSCGVPVAAFPVEGPLALVKNDVNGYLDEDLKKAALRCLTIDRAGCRQTAKRFSWAYSTQQFLNNLVVAGERFPAPQKYLAHAA